MLLLYYLFIGNGGRISKHISGDKSALTLTNDGDKKNGFSCQERAVIRSSIGDEAHPLVGCRLLGSVENLIQ